MYDLILYILIKKCILQYNAIIMTKIYIHYLLLISVVSIIYACKKPIKGDILITDTNVVDVEGGKVLEHMYVLISGDSIVDISGNKSSFEAKQIIDGDGKYLIPGLWDMHTHNWWDKHFSNYYIANGVLGLRNMYTPMKHITPLKDSIANNLIDGPYYFAAGRVIEGKGADFPDWLVIDKEEDILPALDTLQKEGSDFVKVYNKIPANLYYKLVNEAHKRGMRVEGHVPMAISAVDASNAGQLSIEHLLGIPELCTHDSLFKDRKDNNWFGAVMKFDDYATIKIDEELAKKNFDILKKNNTYVCPTLVVWYNYLHPDSGYEKNPVTAKFEADVKDYWSGEIGNYRKKEPAQKAMMLKKYATMQKVTYLLYKNGVKLIAGTDAINPYVYPGFALHTEFKLLKAAGIPDSYILKMGTINAAQYLGLENKYGQVKPGKKASLVLLAGNPLQNIENTNKIEAVILNGKVITKDKLKKMSK